MLALALALVTGVAGCGGGSSGSGGSGGRDLSSATAAARAFLTAYVDPDGRVVRRDQGGDTVSEGQGYALLLAVVLGDKARFQRVW